MILYHQDLKTLIKNVFLFNFAHEVLMSFYLHVKNPWILITVFHEEDGYNGSTKFYTVI